MRSIRIGAFIFAIIASAIGGIVTYGTSAVSALSASDWNASNIIDDAVFYDNTSMSTADIQAFMNSKNPSCDTNGTKPASEYGRPDLTHAQYATQVEGWPGPPYVCLRDYYQVPRSDQNINNLSTNIRPEGSISAAEIIKRASDTYGVSPKVLLVLIQKESVGPLLTDSWPIPAQYRSVVGYGCPDTAPCDAKYAGFYNQIMNAAYQFKYYKDHAYDKYPDGRYWYNHQPYNTVSLRFNPNINCGSTSTRMDNYATTGLYNYTPYQPNRAALDDMYGYGDDCSAHGNRNFWTLFSNWFGSTKGGEAPIKDSVFISQPLTITPNGSNDDKQIYTASFTLKNKSSTKINVGWMVASVRDSQNFNLDFPAKSIIIEPNSTYTYTASRTFQWTDNMSAFINGNISQNIGWSTAIPASETGISKTTSFRVGSDVVITGQGLKIERLNSSNTFKATVSFKNRTNQDKNIGWFLVSARTPFNTNVDFPAQSITVPANGTYTYSQERTLDLSDLGSFKFYVNLNDTAPGGLGWTTTYPMSNDIWVKRSSSYLNGPGVIQSEPLITSTDGTGGMTSTVAFTNQGNTSESLGWVIISTRRSGDSTNYDYKPQALTLKPGETMKLTFKQQALRGGDYTTSLIFNRPNGWTTTYAPPAKATINRSADANVTYAVKQIGEPLVSKVNGKTQVSITLKNDAQQQVNLGWTILQVRDTNGNNLDFPGIYTELKANETKTFTTTRQLYGEGLTLSATNNHPTYRWGPMFSTDANVYPHLIE